MDDATGIPLAVEVRESPPGWQVRVAGELDAASIASFESALAPTEPGPGDVVIDVSEVEFIDSTGLRAILALRERIQERGGSLRLSSPSRQVERLLGVTGLSEHLLLEGDAS